MTNPTPAQDARALAIEALRKTKTCSLATEVRELVNAALAALAQPATPPATPEPVAWQWRKRLCMYAVEQIYEWTEWEALQPPYMGARDFAKTDPANYESRPLYAAPVASPATPADFRLVPRFQTAAMERAAVAEVAAVAGLPPITGTHAAICWRAMLAAAPATPAGEPDDTAMLLDWMERDLMQAEPVGIEYRDGAFGFPYLVSGAGGFGGGVGFRRCGTLREAIRAAIKQARTE